MFKLKFLKNFFYAAASLGGVQGTIYLLQLLSAGQMNEASYSLVRIFESAAAIGALIVTFGVPSAVLVKLASSGAQSRLIISALLLMVATGTATAILYFISSPGDHRFAIAILAGLVSFRLFFTATTQAREDFNVLAAASVIASALSITTFFLRDGDLGRWLVARYALEIVMSAILIANEIRQKSVFDNKGEEILKPLLILAVPVGASLVIRSVVEHGPILWLAFIHAQTPVIARVGIVITLGTIALMPGVVLQSVIVPRLAKSRTKAEMLRAIRLLIPAIAMTGLLFAVLASIADIFLDWANLHWPIIAAGSLMVIGKMSAGSSGGILLAHHRSTAILILNSTTLASAFVAAVGAITSGTTAETILWIIAAIEIFAAVIYIISVARLLESEQLSPA